MPEAYIVSARRTAGGRRNGRLAGIHPAELGAVVLDAIIAGTGVDPAAIDDVIIGYVSQVGEQAFALGRNVALASSLPDSVPTLHARGKRYGLQTMCEGGGIANVAVIERL